jgi:hypothetical protein
VPHDYHVIAGVLPLPTPDDLKKTRFNELSPFFIRPIYLTGRILQLLLNWRSRTYAGSHRVAAVLMIACELTHLGGFIPSLVGRFDARPSLTANEVVETTLIMVGCWQALTLPSVNQTSEDDHTE